MASRQHHDLLEPIAHLGEALAHRRPEELLAGSPEITELLSTAGRRVAELMIAAGKNRQSDLAAVLDTLHQESDLHHSVLQPVWRDLVMSVVGEHAELIRQRALAEERAARVAQRQAVDELRASEERFRTLFQAAPVAIAIAQLDGAVLEFNDALREMFGQLPQALRTLNLEALVDDGDAGHAGALYRELVTGRRDTFRVEKRLRVGPDRQIWVDLSLTLIRNPDGSPRYQLAVLQDITSSQAVRDQLHHAATHDSLTGLPNRSLFLQWMQEATSDAPPERHVRLCFLDLDGFKLLNDAGGHLLGDLVLGEVAQRLRTATEGTGARVARLGGDEFVVLSIIDKDCSDDQITEDGDVVPGERSPDCLADRLLQALEAPVQLSGAQPIDVRASIGAVELPAAESTAESLLQAANRALRLAKQEGKDRVVVYDRTVSARQQAQMTIALSLCGAEARGEMDVVYQPMVRLDDGTLHGVEALLCWRHPGLGLLTPERFLQTAEASGDIVALGDWLLDRVCGDLQRHDWPSATVNLSVRQLYRNDLAQRIVRLLRRGQLAPQRLRIEVTETLLTKRQDDVPLRALRDLAELGVPLVLDDFGRGCANLVSIVQLPFTEIKLASSFAESWLVQGGPDDTDSRLVRAMVDLVHGLGMTVTAEGIETPDQAAWAREHGCEVGQGWYYDGIIDLSHPDRDQIG